MIVFAKVPAFMFQVCVSKIANAPWFFINTEHPTSCKHQVQKCTGACATATATAGMMHGAYGSAKLLELQGGGFPFIVYLKGLSQGQNKKT
jgi:hypothetical protein